MSILRLEPSDNKVLRIFDMLEVLPDCLSQGRAVAFRLTRLTGRGTYIYCATALVCASYPVSTAMLEQLIKVFAWSCEALSCDRDHHRTLTQEVHMFPLYERTPDSKVTGFFS